MVNSKYSSTKEGRAETNEKLARDSILEMYKALIENRKPTLSFLIRGKIGQFLLN